jgi:teichuronic acid exporter
MSQSGTSMNARQSARGALVLGLRHICTMVLSGLSAVLLARWLTPHDFGAFESLYFIVYGFSMVFGDLGISVALVRQPDEPSRDSWAAAIRVCTTMAATAIVVSMLGALLAFVNGRHTLSTWILGLGLALGFRCTRAVCSAQLLRAQNFSRIAAIETMEFLIYYSVVIGLAAFGFGVSALVGATVLKEIGGALALRLITRIPPWRRVTTSSAVTSLLKVGGPSQAAGLLITVTDFFQPVCIGGFLGSTALGYTSWAYDLSMLPIFLIATLDRVVLPTLARAQRDKTRLAALTARAVRLNCLVGFAIVLGIVVDRHELITHVFGSQWLPAESLILMFMPAIITTAMTNPVIHAFNALGRTTMAMKLTGAWFLLTWTGGTVTTLVWGLHGFGLFYVVLQATYLYMWRAGRRHLGVHTLRESLPALAGMSAGIGVGLTFHGVGGVTELILRPVFGLCAMMIVTFVLSPRTLVDDISTFTRALVGKVRPVEAHEVSTTDPSSAVA